MSLDTYLLVFLLICNVVIMIGVIAGVIAIRRGLNRFERELQTTVNAAVNDIRQTANGFTELSGAGKRVLEEMALSQAARKVNSGSGWGAGKMAVVPAAVDLTVRAISLWRQLRPQNAERK